MGLCIAIYEVVARGRLLLALKLLDGTIVCIFLIVGDADQYQIAVEIGEPAWVLIVVDLIDGRFDIFVEFEFDDNRGLVYAFFGQQDDIGKALACGELADDVVEIFGIKAQHRNDTS